MSDPGRLATGRRHRGVPRFAPARQRQAYRAAIVSGAAGLALSVGLIFLPAGIIVASIMLLAWGIVSLGTMPGPSA